MNIGEVKQYVDLETGQAVTEIKSLTDAKYQGTAPVVYTMPDGRKVTQPKTFTIEASNLTEAFSKFKSSLDAQLVKDVELQKERMNKIQIAQSVPAGKIVDMFQKDK
jgi:hypothetical protein